MRYFLMVVFCVVLLSGCGKSDEQKAQEALQKKAADEKAEEEARVEKLKALIPRQKLEIEAARNALLLSALKKSEEELRQTTWRSVFIFFRLPPALADALVFALEIEKKEATKKMEENKVNKAKEYEANKVKEAKRKKDEDEDRKQKAESDLMEKINTMKRELRFELARMEINGAAEIKIMEGKRDLFEAETRNKKVTKEENIKAILKWMEMGTAIEVRKKELEKERKEREDKVSGEIRALEYELSKVRRQ